MASSAAASSSVLASFDDAVIVRSGKSPKEIILATLEYYLEQAFLVGQIKEGYKEAVKTQIANVRREGQSAVLSLAESMGIIGGSSSFRNLRQEAQKGNALFWPSEKRDLAKLLCLLHNVLPQPEIELHSIPLDEFKRRFAEIHYWTSRAFILRESLTFFLHDVAGLMPAPERQAAGDHAAVAQGVVSRMVRPPLMSNGGATSMSGFGGFSLSNAALAERLALRNAEVQDLRSQLRAVQTQLTPIPVILVEEPQSVVAPVVLVQEQGVQAGGGEIPPVQERPLLPQEFLQVIRALQSAVRELSQLAEEIRATERPSQRELDILAAGVSAYAVLFSQAIHPRRPDLSRGELQGIEDEYHLRTGFPRGATAASLGEAAGQALDRIHVREAVSAGLSAAVQETLAMFSPTRETIRQANHARDALGRLIEIMPAVLAQLQRDEAEVAALIGEAVAPAPVTQAPAAAGAGAEVNLYSSEALTLARQASAAASASTLAPDAPGQ